MLSLYTFTFRVFLFVAPLFSWVSPKFKKWLKARDQWRTDVQGFLKTGRVMWFHCASVGEFEQARPVIESLKEEDPSIQIVLTFFSSSGYEVRKGYPLAEVVTYLPSDLPKEMSAFLDSIQPDMVVFVKYEFWWNAMQAVKDRSIPMILISAYLTDKHWYTQWPGIHLGQRLVQFDRIFTQEELTKARLSAVNINNTVIAGDTRVDRVLQNALAPYDLPGIDVFCKDKKILVIGSNWPSDDEVVMTVVKRQTDLAIIVAPHEIKHGQIEHWKKHFDPDVALLSDVEARKGSLDDKRVLLVDKIGVLSKLYRYGDVAYVGGGFGKAVHNTLEASVYGIPVIFGPANKRFQEIQELKELGVGMEVKDAAEFESSLRKALNDGAFREEAEQKLDRYFEERGGATQVVVNWINTEISGQSPE